MTGGATPDARRRGAGDVPVNHGHGGDGQEPADATNVMPPRGSAAQSGERGTRPTENVQRRARPGAPDAPPPPPEAFRPAGPPPPADAFRPGRRVRPADGDPEDEAEGEGATQLLGEATQVVRRSRAPKAAGGQPGAAGAPDASAAYGPPAGAGAGYAPPAGYAQPAPGVGGQPGYDPAASGPREGAPHTGGTYLDSGGHVRPVFAGNGAAGPYGGEAGPYGAESGPLPAGGAQQPPGGPGGSRPAPGGPAPAKRKRRRGRILAFVVVLLLVLFVVGDRVAVAIARDQMEKQVEVSVAESLEPGATPPTVRNVAIGGFPFLTQVLFGKFKDISVTIEGIPTPGPRISEVDANLKGVHVPLGDALSDSIGEVPVDDVRATVRITYDDLNAYLETVDPVVQVTPVDGGEKVEIAGSLLGQQISGVTTFEVENNELTLVPSEIGLAGGINATIPLPGGLRLPSIPIPIAGLPFDLNIVQASTDATGLSLTATAKDVVLPAAPKPAGDK
ncbi:LmeA family phospholipid-binding protein [Parafrankia colletiae]|uniref:LmeA family phospholipid-binding protein n=1 Tax=Parafrankia colletiae TaxID=573497 RepID=UPI001F51CBA2|nr:DUF2993 domain-containing protein [Parafrankia colletiae]